MTCEHWLKTHMLQMAGIGYACVSTTDQDLDIQLSKLRAEGCDLIRSEKKSGASREDRDELATIIAFLRPADELVVSRSRTMERKWLLLSSNSSRCGGGLGGG